MGLLKSGKKTNNGDQLNRFSDGVLYVSDEIMNKVKEKELIRRCLKVRICPKCGGYLMKEDGDGSFFTYECDDCSFEYIDMV